ncbi:MAG: homoserine kinase [Acidiferrobacterales bacterium]
MSVYTRIGRAELESFLSNYHAGQLSDFEGIQSGIENTNYFVNTSTGKFVLTIFEHHTKEELPFFLDLTAFLSEHAIPCAHPKADNSGAYLGELKGKPAALVARLAGKSLEQPQASHCQSVGQVLAKLHNAGQQFPQTRENPRGPHWWHETAKILDGHLATADRELLEDELYFQKQFRLSHLPRGIIHADLFRDNVLFAGDVLGGLIDFYYACTDVLLFDLAITVNDWCVNKELSLDSELTSAMTTAYIQTRPLGQDEIEAWPIMLRAAALRFWLSRLYDKHFPRPGEMTHTHDPDVLKHVLIHHRNLEGVSLQTVQTT